MKGSLFSNTMRRFAAFVLLNAPITMVTQQQVQDKPVEKVKINAEAIFPHTPYKKALDASMRLVGDMQDLQVQTGESKQMLSMDMTDLLVGKLCRLKQAVDMIRNGNKFSVLSQDIEYLKGVVGLIDSGRGHLLFDASDDSVQLLGDLVADIRGTLDFLE